MTRANPFQRGQRVAQVVEDAEQQHQVELSDLVRVEPVDVGPPVLDRRAEPLARRQELVHAEAVPGVAVHRQHALGTAPFALEREEAVPGADVQHRPAGEVLGNAEQPQAAGEAAPGPPLVRQRRRAGVRPADDLVRPFGHGREGLGERGE